MALANSGVQEEVDGMIMKTNLGIGGSHHHHNHHHHHENQNGNFVFRNTTNYQLLDHQQPQISQSLINFKCGIDNVFHKNNNESLLSFEPQGVFQDTNYNWDQQQQQQRLVDDPNCFQTATSVHSYSSSKENYKNGDGSVYEWLYSEETTVVSDGVQDAEPAQEIGNHKRSHMGDGSGGVCKKQCTAAANNKKQKSKSSPTAKDPQSIAAKNRRERISERLKILQELVPNGSKVDLVTMLEKAISYVKFLQLQVKILATDDFWPVQGGKAPDISQVKEAIDVILSSQRERSSSSNSEK